MKLVDPPLNPSIPLSPRGQYRSSSPVSSTRVISLSPLLGDDEEENLIYFEEPLTRYEQSKQRVRKFIDNDRCVITVTVDDIMMLATIFALFGDDFKLLAFSVSADSTFEIISSISFCLFVMELCATCWAKTTIYFKPFEIVGYFGSFFFWLDVIATVSLLPETSFVGDVAWLNWSDASKASRAGSKAGRIVRMVRLVRLIKLYKVAMDKRQNLELERLIEDGLLDRDAVARRLVDNEIEQETKVGAKLSGTTTRRVIIGVLLMLVLIPTLTVEEEQTIDPYSTKFLHEYNNVGVGGNDTLVLSFAAAEYAASLASWVGHDYLIFLSVEPALGVVVDRPELEAGLRANEITSERIENGTFVTSARFNHRPTSQTEALFGLLLTLFVTIMLVVGAARFNADAQKLVLKPIENLVNMVEQMARDPLKPYVKRRAVVEREEGEDKGGEGVAGEYETKLLEDAIHKISGLLRVGFGEAGADIIAQNIHVDNESSTSLDPMVPGRRVKALFGFCDISQFSDVTALLQGDVMEFVNGIAAIIHVNTVAWGGAVNKNLGNSFLLVWPITMRVRRASKRVGMSGPRRRSSTGARRRGSVTNGGGGHAGNGGSPASSGLGPMSPSSEASGVRGRRGSVRPNAAQINDAQFLSDNEKNEITELRRMVGVSDLADKAVIAFLRCIVDLNRAPNVLAYREHATLVKQLPGYRVRMAFGLHVGWAIEGAIGSIHKVDASYLSPHVNLAARMESATRQYGVPLLISHPCYSLFSFKLQTLCRKVDVVTVKGSVMPIPIYTYEANQDAVAAVAVAPSDGGLQFDSYHTDLWELDADLVALRVHASPEFLYRFKDALTHYLDGNWPVAFSLFQQCISMSKDKIAGGDGPSKTLMRYLREHSCQPPSDWKGYRELASK